MEVSMDAEKRGFASDNNSGVHPLIMEEILKVNRGHTLGYGSDKYTDKAISLFKEHLGEHVQVFFVYNGTAANVLGITAASRPWNSIITAFTAHIEQDECGAPEKFAGCKVLTVDTPDGKISPEMLSKHMHGIGFEHHSQPKIISITQATEMGTVYTKEEIKSLADYAHRHQMLLHVDGARISNAAVHLGLPFREFTADAGVDILSFGGTKNGMMFGEAVCFFKPGLSDDFRYIRKQGMQLTSKMRYISAQYIAYLRDGLWKMLAEHSNAMAGRLYSKIKDIKGISVTQKVQSNGVFLTMPPRVAEELQKSYYFYGWNEEISEYRLMTSWDTETGDIDRFTDCLRIEMSKHS